MKNLYKIVKSIVCFLMIMSVIAFVGCKVKNKSPEDSENPDEKITEYESLENGTHNVFYENGNKTIEDCDFGEWVIRTEPSVNKDGIEIRVCKKCLYFEERIIEAPHTHVFDAPEYKWAEDKTTVTASMKCECGYKEEETQKVIESGTGATCTEKGYRQYETFPFNNPNFEIQVVKEEISELGHQYIYTSNEDGTHKKECVNNCGINEISNCNFDEWETIKEATEKEVGLKRSVCEKCKEVREQEIPVIHEHYNRNSWTDIQAPTCTEKGSKGTYCEVTGCDVLIIEVSVNATGHHFKEWTEVKTPTFEEAGLARRVCENDSEHIEEKELPIINKKNYSFKTSSDGRFNIYEYNIGNQLFQYVIENNKMFISSSNDSLGYVIYNGNGFHKENEEITVTARALEGAIFTGWYYNGELINNEAIYTFNMPNETFNLTAMFNVVDINADDIVVDVWDGSIAEFIEYGDGSKANPYIIKKASELALVANKVNNSSVSYSNAYYKLSNHIDLNNINWTPIGIYKFSRPNVANINRKFNGTFDGNGYIIFNLKIENEAADNNVSTYIGLFGNCGPQAILKNIGIENIDIDLTFTYYENNTGGLVGYTEGNIEACYTTGDINVVSTSKTQWLNGTNGAGLAGQAKDIYNSYSTCNVSVTASQDNAGAYGLGLASNIYGSYATGNIYAKSTNLVFACGLSSSKVRNCFATGNVTGISEKGIAKVGKVGIFSDRVKESYYLNTSEISSNTNNVYSYGTAYSISELYSEDFYNKVIKPQGSWQFKDGKYSVSIFDKSVKESTLYKNVTVKIIGNGNVDKDLIYTKKNTLITINALPDYGYKVKEWKYNGNTWTDSNKLMFSIDGTTDVEVTVEFVPATGRYTYFEQQGNYEFQKTYYGNVFDLKVVDLYDRNANSLIGWYINGNLVSTDNCYVVLYTEEELKLTAKKHKNHDIYIYNSFYRNDYILISGTETEEVILTAQEIAGYKFTGWYDGEVLISEEMEYTFTVEDREYKFEAKYEKE